MFSPRRITRFSLLLLICALMVGGIVVAQDSSKDELLGPVPGYKTWADVLAAAKGTTVNWYMWGGSDKINTDVDTDIGKVVKDMYGITLNRVPVNDTADVVNKVLDEAAAKVEKGSVDLIWINGENFRTLKDAKLLFGPWSESIPNAKYVDWKSPALAYDFGVPVEGYESPWGHAQFVMEYNTALVGEKPPATFEELATWIHAHPGLFTYPAIPDFTGSVFLRHLFYWAAGTTEPFTGAFDQATYDKYAPKVWAYLEDIKPDLWHHGDTYPDAPAMKNMLANQEVAFSMTYGPADAAADIQAGTFPDTIRTFVFDTGTISNNNFVTIPYDAPNPAGAMVIANFMLSEQYQLVLVDPTKWGWLSPISPTSYSQSFQDAVSKMQRHPATLPADVLAAHALPEPRADWVTAIEKGWTDNVLKK